MTPSHQMMRLSKGKHGSPSEGACVMELASMLAGEPFSDHPETACPVIAGFMRAYNDGVDDDRRQDLYRYAAEVVDTRSTSGVVEAREQRCLEWMDEVRQQQPRMLRWTVRKRPKSVDRRFGSASVGKAAGHLIRRHSDRTHAAALALIDELIAMGAPKERAATEVQLVDRSTADLVAATV